MSPTSPAPLPRSDRPDRTTRHPTFLIGTAAIAALLLGAGRASATELLTNSSFESGNFVNTVGGYEYLDPGATDMTGWTVINHRIAWAHVPNSDGIGSADGAYFLDMSGPGAGSLGGITQNVNTTPGQEYSFSIALYTLNNPFTVQVDAGSLSQQVTQSHVRWDPFDFTFTAIDAVTPITIAGITSGIGNNMAGVDHLSVTAVPEPTAVALLTLAALPLLSRKRNRPKAGQ